MLRLHTSLLSKRFFNKNYYHLEILFRSRRVSYISESKTNNFLSEFGKTRVEKEITENLHIFENTFSTNTHSTS